MKKVLTIAGSDCSGGAGIQADIKTMTMHGVYAMSAITALTAQNTTGVAGVMEVSPKFFRMQLESIFTDIYPDAVKIGMVSSATLIHVIAEMLKKYPVEHVVVDPVMISTSGHRLLETEAQEAMVQELIPLATLLTPNIPEAEVLSGIEIQTEDDMARAAETIAKKGTAAVLVKGGHEKNTANDYLWQPDGGYWFYGERIENPNTHGTGCTLSSAIASNLAKGEDMRTSIQNAKTYLSNALRAGLDIGKGSGPLNHMA
ncbi:MAG: bifunctional hydroxymethylpyrimidine kinase/phosphomethylpyrimidine kinase [Lachnospiraceae bacterium]